MSPHLHCYALTAVILLGASPGRAQSPSKRDCVVANEGAQLLVQNGKRLEAERKLSGCMAASCPIPVREDCAQRLLEVERTIPSIVFEWNDRAGSAIRVTRVTADGQPSPDALLGRPLRLDAGEHQFVFEAEGMSPLEKTFFLHDGESRQETIVFATLEAAPTPSTAGPVEDGPRAPRPSSEGVPALAYAVGGAGVAGLALGIVAGLAASSKNAALEAECSGNDCPLGSQHDIDSFRTLRDWSTVGYVVGAVGLASGAILWVTAPKASATVTTIGLCIGPRGAGFAGTF